MNKQNPFVMGAVVAIAGVIIGTSSAVFASKSAVAFASSNPNLFSPGVRRVVGVDAGRSSAHLEPVQPEVEHAAAGEEVGIDPMHCDGLSRQRLTHCLVELQNNIMYQLGQMGR